LASSSPTQLISILIVNKQLEDQKILERLDEEQEESKYDYKVKTNLSSRHKFSSKLRDGEIAKASLSHYNNRSKMNISTLNNQELPSVSVSSIRNKESPQKKTSLLKQIKTKHPNSRLFKADIQQEHY
jgi:hypothetical protein